MKDREGKRKKGKKPSFVIIRALCVRVHSALLSSKSHWGESDSRHRFQAHAKKLK